MPNERPHKINHMLMIARVVSLRSSCVRRTVGCVLTDQRYHILGTGYNGTAHGERNCTDEPCKGATEPHGTTILCEAIHAEANALLHCSSRDKVWGAFCTDSPCIQCARLMTSLPSLKAVFYVRHYSDDGIQFLKRQGLLVEQHAFDEDDIFAKYERPVFPAHIITQDDETIRRWIDTTEPNAPTTPEVDAALKRRAILSGRKERS